MRIRGSFLAAAMALLGLASAACGGGRSAGSPSSPGAAGPRVGDPAPAFSLPSAQGGTVSLGEFRRKAVLLYFSMGST